MENNTILTFHTHYRVIDESLKLEINSDGSLVNPRGITTKGGCTVACIEIAGELHWGVSRCSNKDNFNKRLGRIRSFGLARGRSAAITPMLDEKGIVEVSNEFARVSLGAIRRTTIAFNPTIIRLYQVENHQFNKLVAQQSFL